VAAGVDDGQRVGTGQELDGIVVGARIGVELQDRIATVYTEVTRGDAAPTAAQVNATATLQQALTGLLSTWKQLQADLPALNARLRAGKLAPIRAELPPPRDLNAADRD